MASPAALLPADVASGLEPHALSSALDAARSLLAAMPPGATGGPVLSIGDSDTVLRLTRQVLIDAVKGYPEEECRLAAAAMGPILRDRSLSRGLFVVRGDGTLVSTGRELHPIAGLVPPFDALDPESIARALTRASRAAAVAASRARGRVALFAKGEEIPLHQG